MKGIDFMGYTHYWEVNEIRGSSKVNEVRYMRALNDCNRIIKAYYNEFGGLSGYSAHCKLNEYGGLKVNGKGCDAHEDFTMREHFNENSGFNFCKTARKPYDIVVIACLSVLAHRLGHAFKVSSDGMPSDWLAGVKLARKITGLKIKNPIATNSVDQVA
jgi:hypothetical protein